MTRRCFVLLRSGHLKANNGNIRNCSRFANLNCRCDSDVSWTWKLCILFDFRLSFCNLIEIRNEWMQLTVDIPRHLWTFFLKSLANLLRPQFEKSSLILCSSWLVVNYRWSGLMIKDFYVRFAVDIVSVDLQKNLTWQRRESQCFVRIEIFWISNFRWIFVV